MSGWRTLLSSPSSLRRSGKVFPEQTRMFVAILVPVYVFGFIAFTLGESNHRSSDQSRATLSMRATPERTVAPDRHSFYEGRLYEYSSFHKEWIPADRTFGGIIVPFVILGGGLIGSLIAKRSIFVRQALGKIPPQWIPWLTASLFLIGFVALSINRSDLPPQPTAPSASVSRVERVPHTGERFLADPAQTQFLVQWLVTQQTPDGQIPLLVEERTVRWGEDKLISGNDPRVGPYALTLTPKPIPKAFFSPTSYPGSTSLTIKGKALGLEGEGNTNALYVLLGEQLDRIVSATPSPRQKQILFSDRFWNQEQLPRHASYLVLQPIYPGDTVVSQPMTTWWPQLVAEADCLTPTFSFNMEPLLIEDLPNRHSILRFGNATSISNHPASVSDDRLGLSGGTASGICLFLLFVSLLAVFPFTLRGALLALAICVAVAVGVDRFQLALDVERVATGDAAHKMAVINQISRNVFYRGTASEALVHCFRDQSNTPVVRLHALAALTDTLRIEDRPLVIATLKAGSEDPDRSVRSVCRRVLVDLQPEPRQPAPEPKEESVGALSG